MVPVAGQDNGSHPKHSQADGNQEWIPSTPGTVGNGEAWDRVDYHTDCRGTAPEAWLACQSLATALPCVCGARTGHGEKAVLLWPDTEGVALAEELGSWAGRDRTVEEGGARGWVRLCLLLPVPDRSVSPHRASLLPGVGPPESLFPSDPLLPPETLSG